jgi:hypothetical protein
MEINARQAGARNSPAINSGMKSKATVSCSMRELRRTRAHERRQNSIALREKLEKLPAEWKLWSKDRHSISCQHRTSTSNLR